MSAICGGCVRNVISSKRSVFSNIYGQESAWMPFDRLPLQIVSFPSGMFLAVAPILLSWTVVCCVLVRAKRCRCLNRLAKWMAARPATCCCSCIVTFSMVVGLCWMLIALNETFNRAFEYTFMKRGSPIHDFFQTSLYRTPLMLQPHTLAS